MSPGGPASGVPGVPPQQQAGIVKPRQTSASVEATAAASVRMAPELTPRDSDLNGLSTPELLGADAQPVDHGRERVALLEPVLAEQVGKDSVTDRMSGRG
jgi:hypothetical protein